MQNFYTKINESGRVLIPAPIRKQLNLKRGDEIVISLSKNNDIRIQTVKQSLSKLQSFLKKKNVKLSEELIKIRRKETI